MTISRYLLVSATALALAAGCKKNPEPVAPAEPAQANAAAAKAAAGPNPEEAARASDIPAPPDVAAPPADAPKTAGGVSYKVLTPGTGTEKPNEWDKVTVDYTGWTTDGKMFDSSVKRGQPATFGLKQVIPGWTEAVSQMVKGEKRRIWIPEALAYQGRPGRPQGMLVFDVELKDFEHMPPPPPVPDDLKKPGAGAKTTKSGLISRVLEKGTGKEHPKPDSVVRVHYTGWTQSDGQMFDSSVVRGEPATFPLNQVIPGWTEGVALMVKGEKRRLWIPGSMAYDGRRGPQGTLVFDVELIDILGSAGAPPPGIPGH